MNIDFFLLLFCIRWQTATSGVFLIHLALGTDADAASCTNAVGTPRGLPRFGRVSILELDHYRHVQSQY